MSMLLANNQKWNYHFYLSSRLSIPGSGVPAGDSLRTGLLRAGWPHFGRQGERRGERSSNTYTAQGAPLLPLRKTKDVLRWWSPNALPWLWREGRGDCECFCFVFMFGHTKCSSVLSVVVVHWKSSTPTHLGNFWKKIFGLNTSQTILLNPFPFQVTLS